MDQHGPVSRFQDNLATRVAEPERGSDPKRRRMGRRHQMKGSSRTSTGILFAVAAAVLFAVNGNVSKIALLNGISSLHLVSMRSAGTALVLLSITALTNPGALRTSRRELGFLALYGVTGIAMVQWLYFVALQRMPVGIALLFEYTAPLMVALWVRFVQKEPVKSRLWLGLACALGGLALVAQFWKGMTLDPIGLVSAVGAGAALACYYLMGEHGQQERDPISLMGFSFGFSAVLWAIVSPWPGFPFARLTDSVDLPGSLPGSAPLWLMVAWIIVLGTVAPFLLVLLAVARLGPARVGLIGMLEPVGAGIIAWVLLGESLNTVQVIGTFIVLVGIVLAETARQTTQPAPQEPDGTLHPEGASPLPEGMAP
jgi:drug/metabolite transporter (DMT)-like permease